MPGCQDTWMPGWQDGKLLLEDLFSVCVSKISHFPLWAMRRRSCRNSSIEYNTNMSTSRLRCRCCCFCFSFSCSATEISDTGKSSRNGWEKSGKSRKTRITWAAAFGLTHFNAPWGSLLWRQKQSVSGVAYSSPSVGCWITGILCELNLACPRSGSLTFHRIGVLPWLVWDWWKGTGASHAGPTPCQLFTNAFQSPHWSCGKARKSDNRRRQSGRQ